MKNEKPTVACKCACADLHFMSVLLSTLGIRGYDARKTLKLECTREVPNED